MPSVSLSSARTGPGALLRAFGAAWLLAGTLDITAACTQYVLSTHKSPLGVLRFVASGLFGPAALTGGPAMAAWGLGLHFVVAGLWTAFYFGLYPRLPLAGRHPVVAGLLYGGVVWLVMNLVVVPASGAPRLPFQVRNALIGAGILMLCIGLPIALLTHRYYAGRGLVPLANSSRE